MVRYLATAAARIVGARTGRTYDFTGAAPLYIVAAADAPALLASPHFRRG
jgi:hypothetical protein